MIADIAFELQPLTSAPLLRAGLALFRCPECGGGQLTLYRDESLDLHVVSHAVVVCENCKKCFNYEHGILILHPERPAFLTVAQRSNFVWPVFTHYQSLWRSWCMSLFMAQRFPNAAESEKLIRLIDWDSLPEDAVFVDLGTSHGFYATTIAGHLRQMNKRGLVIAFDFSLPMLKQAALRAQEMGLADRILWVSADVQKNPLTPAGVDRITCGGGLNEYGRPDVVLQEVTRLLNHRGAFVGMFLQRGPGLIGLVQDLVHHVTGLRFLSKTHWHDHFAKSGLRIVSDECKGIVRFTVARR